MSPAKEPTARAVVRGMVRALHAAMNVMVREAENYRDGERYQPHGQHLQMMADLAAKHVARGRKFLEETKPTRKVRR